MNVNINGVSITLTQEQLEQIAKQTAKKPAVFKPKIGETYWYITMIGEVSDDKWDECSVDEFRLSAGLIYRTKEEAEKAKDIQFAKTRLKNAIAEANEGW